MEPVTDAVLLVPGLLGFNRFASFSYFADRVATAIRVGVEARTGRPVLVAALGTLPAAPLAQRQLALFENIENLARGVPSIERVHLVGHSTGGLDAYLAVCDLALSGSFPRGRDLIRSVVTFAAPLLGTDLVQHDAIRLLAGRLRAASGTIDLVKLAVSLRKQLINNVTADDVAAGFMADPREALRYLWELLRHRELLLELSPENIANLLRRCGRATDRVPLCCFATWTPVDPKRGKRNATLFTRLQAMTAAGGNDEEDPSVVANIERMTKGQIFTAGPAVELDPHSNDGLVNTARQLVAGARLGGVVVADHIDVVGQYNRTNPVDNSTIVYELLTSGAGFNDEVFFALFAAISRTIVEAIP
jgi:pimeloyl-ACP methyl ester carboxylesterase